LDRKLTSHFTANGFDVTPGKTMTLELEGYLMLLT
jgi:hypothetical protein